jgi:hypothetical protein
MSLRRGRRSRGARSFVVGGKDSSVRRRAAPLLGDLGPSPAEWKGRQRRVEGRRRRAWGRWGGKAAAAGWKGGGGGVEGQAAALWRAGGGGVEGRRRRGGKRRRAWGRCGGRAASSGATTGVKLGGDVGGGEHRSHFDGLGIAFAFRCWRRMCITVLVCKCFIGLLFRFYIVGDSPL